MNDPLVPLALLAMVLFVVLVVWAARKQRAERARHFQDLAGGHGWRYLDVDDGSAQALSEGFSDFARFRSSSRGDNPPTSVVLGSIDEGRVCLFSHFISKGEGDARLWTLCLIEAPETLGPPLRVSPKSVRRVAVWGDDPEVVTGDRPFDEAFEVRSPDTEEARAVLGARFRRVLLESRTRRLPFPVEIQIRDRRLALHPAKRNDAPGTTVELEAMLELGKELVAALRRDDGSRARAPV